MWQLNKEIYNQGWAIIPLPTADFQGQKMLKLKPIHIIFLAILRCLHLKQSFGSTVNALHTFSPFGLLPLSSGRLYNHIHEASLLQQRILTNIYKSITYFSPNFYLLFSENFTHYLLYPKILSTIYFELLISIGYSIMLFSKKITKM